MIKIHFLGVRGSTPCSGADYLQYGGHTSCVAIEADEQLFIFDAGSGIVSATKLGFSVPSQQTELFLSHTHLDHIMGLPFYIPFWRKDHKINIYAGHMAPYGGIKDFFTRTFSEPLFPVPFAAFPAQIACIDFKAGTRHNFKNVTVDSFSLNHPNGATGYRLTCGGKSVCYITDHEHDPAKAHEGLTAFIKDADLLIYDATYSDLNFATYKGWGHSTWQEAIRIGQAASVKKIGIFHHDPQNTDDKMAVIEAEIKAMCPKGLITRQGMVIEL